MDQTPGVPQESPAVQGRDTPHVNTAKHRFSSYDGLVIPYNSYVRLLGVRRIKGSALFLGTGTRTGRPGSPDQNQDKDSPHFFLVTVLGKFSAPLSPVETSTPRN